MVSVSVRDKVTTHTETLFIILYNYLIIRYIDIIKKVSVWVVTLLRTETETMRLSFFFVLGGYSVLYKASERLPEFVTHAYGVAVYAEPSSHLHGLEVGAQRAVVLAGDGDILPAEHMRISLSGCGG